MRKHVNAASNFAGNGSEMGLGALAALSANAAGTIFLDDSIELQTQKEMKIQAAKRQKELAAKEAALAAEKTALAANFADEKKNLVVTLIRNSYTTKEQQQKILEAADIADLQKRVVEIIQSEIGDCKGYLDAPSNQSHAWLFKPVLEAVEMDLTSKVMEQSCTDLDKFNSAFKALKSLDMVKKESSVAFNGGKEKLPMSQEACAKLGGGVIGGLLGLFGILGGPVVIASAPIGAIIVGFIAWFIHRLTESPEEKYQRLCRELTEKPMRVPNCGGRGVYMFHLPSDNLVGYSPDNNLGLSA